MEQPGFRPIAPAHARRGSQRDPDPQTLRVDDGWTPARTRRGRERRMHADHPAPRPATLRGTTGLLGGEGAASSSKRSRTKAALPATLRPNRRSQHPRRPQRRSDPAARAQTGSPQPGPSPSPSGRPDHLSFSSDHSGRNSTIAGLSRAESAPAILNSSDAIREELPRPRGSAAALRRARSTRVGPSSRAQPSAPTRRPSSRAAGCDSTRKRPEGSPLRRRARPAMISRLERNDADHVPRRSHALRPARTSRENGTPRTALGGPAGPETLPEVDDSAGAW